MYLIFILYDSINNSVFAGQVWQVLLAFLAQNKYQKIRLISFETKLIQHSYHHPNIEVIQIKRTKYLGKISLLFNLIHLKKYLPKTNYQLVARGPLAGFIANQLVMQQNCRKLTIQARGLLAEEYLYNQAKTNIFRQSLAKIRYLQLARLEQQVYRTCDKKINIECVSQALKNYLIKTFKIKNQRFALAQDDLPTKIKPSLLRLWRDELRLKFNISPNAQVYCYAGSNHKWQCITQTISFFKNQLLQDKTALLLILTKDTCWFDILVKQNQIATTNYCILSVNHSQIYQHLAMADYGLLFRKDHIINWVSRPTKALEYRCAGLKIIHNDTINWLVNKKKLARI